MFKINDYVVYKGDVCKIVDIHFNALKKQDYYVLVPIDDDSLKIDIPTNNKNGYLRNLISKDEVMNIINDIPNISIIENNDKLLESEYRKLLNTYNHYDLLKIIKTTYLRNKERIENKKKISERDNEYFIRAEKKLYNEFSIVLNLNFDDTRDYIVKRVESII